jgi:sulfhydrogenase subunit beta (sulfur reductase)
MGKLLKKEDLNRFLSNLMGRYEIIAPVKRDIVRYEVINDLNDIYLDEKPFFSAKKFFFEPKETLFEFQSRRGFKKRIKPRIIFGMRNCDANALLVLDKLYLNGFPDERYKEKREKTILITIPCDEPEENCFCESLELKDYFDLKFTDIGPSYYIEVGSEKGKRLVHRFKDHKMIGEKKDMDFRKVLNKRKDLKKYFDDKLWKKEAERCLSCSQCTNICPTCTCFDIVDNVELNLREGGRSREADSCQLKSFTEVAGGHVFREARSARLRHFVLHKLQYFKDQHDINMCVGCGRCITICPAGIDLVEISNKLGK